LEGEYGIKWWKPWDIGDDTIGQRYGATVSRYDLMNRLLKGLVEDPFGRRHIISLWQEKDFADTTGLLPCAFMTMFTVRHNLSGDRVLDMTLIQRSSDYLVAGHINKMQYVGFMMMVAKHCGYQVGNFCHFVQNLHIYDRHIEQAKELLSRTPSEWNPVLTLNVPDGTNFYNISADDFTLYGYEPVKPQLKFDLGI
jgi:thymidylate synthase